MFYRSSDQGVTPKQQNGLLNQFRSRRGGSEIGFEQEFGESKQVGERLRRIAQARQLRALGLAGFVPAMRALT